MGESQLTDTWGGTHIVPKEQDHGSLCPHQTLFWEILCVDSLCQGLKGQFAEYRFTVIWRCSAGEEGRKAEEREGEMAYIDTHISGNWSCLSCLRG